MTGMGFDNAKYVSMQSEHILKAAGGEVVEIILLHFLEPCKQLDDRDAGVMLVEVCPFGINDRDAAFCRFYNVAVALIIQIGKSYHTPFLSVRFLPCAYRSRQQNTGIPQRRQAAP